MNQDGDGAAGEPLQDAFAATGAVTRRVDRSFTAGGLPLPVRDFETTAATITVTEAVRVTDLNVTVSLKHTYVGDLTIRLRGPDGRAVVLFSARGGTGNDLAGTTFDDEAVRPLSRASAPFAGRFRPEQRLATFDGTLAAGTWTLEVFDGAAQDTGCLTAWSLAILGTVGWIPTA
jgi:subtilisin-like proprotein convertase family protein